jgi:hypothetical protein
MPKFRHEHKSLPPQKCRRQTNGCGWQSCSAINRTEEGQSRHKIAQVLSPRIAFLTTYDDQNAVQLRTVA